MNEEDYISLQTLLSKLRIAVMKEMGDSNTSTRVREKDLKIIRNIDCLKKCRFTEKLEQKRDV